MKSYKYNRHTIGALCLSVICHLLLLGVVSYFDQPPIEQPPPLYVVEPVPPSWEPRHLPRPVKSVQAAAPRVMVMGRVQVTVPMARRVAVGSGLESLDPVETLATPMEAAELLPSADAGKLLEGLSSGEAVGADSIRPTGRDSGFEAFRDTSNFVGESSLTEAVSDLTPRVDADEQGGVLEGTADYLRGHIRIIIVILLIVGLVLYVICRKSDKGFERFPFNDGGFGD